MSSSIQHKCFNHFGYYHIICLVFIFSHSVPFSQTESHIRKKMEIADGIAPKSIVASGTGLFSAQNMMYRHSVTIYNHRGERLAKIKDEVNLNKMGYSEFNSTTYKGAPVEGVFTSDGQYLWVSNYFMSGGDFANPGCDNCIGTDFDPGFLYKINTRTNAIETVVKVGSVPKFLAISADEKTLIASNWVSSDISIVDLENEVEIKRVKVGAHPRGIAITNDNSRAFVTIMGSTRVAEVNLETYAVGYITDLGKSPRSVILADHDSTLYISLNSSNQILKYNRFTAEKKYCKTLGGPRSMTLTPNQKHLYVVNYFDDAFTKINTDSMRVEAIIPTSSKPIGICGNWVDSEIWVACYSGKIEIFKDFLLEKESFPPTFFGLELPAFDFELNLPIDSTEHVTDATILENQDELAVNNRSPKTNEPTKLPKKQLDHKPIENAATCHFHIIVGAFSVAENAVGKRDELIAMGYPAQIINGKLNYVSIQCFDTKAKAEQEKGVIRSAVADCESAWVLER